MAQITVDPGGSSGWHSHPGGAIVVVKQGSLTVYGSLGSQCQAVTYGAGQAFIGRPGEVDDIFNTGTVPFVLYVTFPRVPQGDSARIDERTQARAVSDDLPEHEDQEGAGITPSWSGESPLRLPNWPLPAF